MNKYGNGEITKTNKQNPKDLKLLSNFILNSIQISFKSFHLFMRNTHSHHDSKIVASFVALKRFPTTRQ